MAGKGNSIVGGNASYQAIGGALKVSATDVTITGTVFEGNSAENAGGVFIDNFGVGSQVSADFTECVWRDNSATVRAGALMMEHGSWQLADCEFWGNSAPDECGGAITAHYDALTLIRCTFGGNSAKYGGAVGAGNGIGASLSPGDVLTLQNCVFSGNSASLAGGALYVPSGNFSPTVNTLACTFTDNTAPQGGWIYWIEPGAG